MTNEHPFIDKLKEQLDEFADELDRLEEKSQKFDQKAREEYRKRADEFEELVREGKSNLEAAKHMSEQELDRMKDFAELTGKAMRNSFNYFMSHYKDYGKDK